MMGDDEPGPSNPKWPRELCYQADDDNSNARLHPNLKKPKRYIIVLDEEEERGEPEDDKNWDPDYNPFFMTLYLEIPRRSRRQLCEAHR